MNADERETMRAEAQRDRETRVRPITVRPPDGRGAAYSGGVEITIDLSAQSSTTIDTNPIELRTWALAMLQFADEIAPRPEPPGHVFDAGSGRQSWPLPTSEA